MRSTSPAATPINVLLVDSAPAGHELIGRLLSEQDRTEFRLEVIAGLDAAAEAIGEQRHDVYLVAYHLGEQTGLEFLAPVWAAGHRPAVVMLVDDAADDIDLGDAPLEIAEILVKGEIDPFSLARKIVHACARNLAVNELVAREQRYELAARAASDAIWDWDMAADQIYLSAGWYSILGREGQEGYTDPSDWFELVHPDDLLRLRAAIDAHLGGDTPRVDCEHRMLGGDGSWRWVQVRGFAGGNGKAAARLTGWLSDIAERHAAELSISQNALHDPLTRLPNRILFIDRLDHATGRARRDPDVPCAVMFVDIDRFELINERLGHTLGDQLLRALGARIAGILRPGDTVSRFGSDEFAVLLDGVDEEQHVTTVAHRIQSAVSQVFRIGGHEVFVTVRVGVAHSAPGMTASELLRNADIAMYEAKRKGRGRMAIYNDRMHHVNERSTRREELHDLVKAGRLGINYQPIVDLATGSIRGFEALARWPEESPPMTPLEFIAIAEQAGLIGELGLHVLQTSLEAMARWRNAGLVSEEAMMSVNISAGQLEDPMFASRLRAAIANANLPPETLRLEITEKTMMKDLELVEAITHEVKDSGIVLHLDDFGTGESSLTVLQRLPVEALKIDRSFVTAMTGRSSTSDAIVRSIIALGHGLGLRLIAEGIEQPAQLRRLRMLGCEYGQGFVFSRPLSAGAIEQLLTAWVPGEIAARGDNEPY